MFLIGLAVGGILVNLWPHRETEKVTLTSLSPDNRVTVSLVEKHRLIDRNFDLRIAGVHPNGVRTVFSSPDEGVPVGSERIVWSEDGKHFLLVGRHFFARPEADLNNGEQLYLLYDLESGRVRCNATQQVGLGTFSIDDVRAIRWRDRLVLEPKKPTTRESGGGSRGNEHPVATFVCPASKDTPGSGEDLDAVARQLVGSGGHCSYQYVGTGNLRDLAPDVVLAVENPSHHGSDLELNVLFGDGSVRHMTGAASKRILDAMSQRARPVRYTGSEGQVMRKGPP